MRLATAHQVGTTNRSDCRKALMGRELMTPGTDRTTRIPSGVAYPITTNYTAKGSVFVNSRNAGN